MKLSKYLIVAIASFLFYACGTTTQVQQTEPKKAVQVQSAAGSSTSTGKCKTFTNKAEEKETQRNYSLYRESFKSGDYSSNLEKWEWIMENAPGFRKTPFIDGIKMYKAQLEGAEGNKKMVLFNKMMALYDKRVECHGEEGKVAAEKAFDLLKYGEDTPENKSKVYELLEKSYAMQGNDTRSIVLKTLYNKYRVDFKNKNKTKEEVQAIGGKMLDVVNANITAGNDVDKFTELKELLESPLTKEVSKPDTPKGPEINSCQDAIDYYGAKDYKNDVQVAKYFYAKLTKMKCYDASQYSELLNILYVKEPTAAVALKLAIAASKAKDYDNAIQYYKRAAELESDPTKQAKYYAYEAGAHRGKKAYQASARAAEKALSINPNSGDAYIALGYAYLGMYGKCGTTQKDKWGTALLAADMFSRAKKDPATAEKAQKAFNTAYKYFPEKNEIFMANIAEGSSVTLGCWINKSTTIRTK